METLDISPPENPVILGEIFILFFAKIKVSFGKTKFLFYLKLLFFLFLDRAL